MRFRNTAERGLMDEHRLRMLEKIVPDVQHIAEPERTILMRRALRSRTSIFVTACGATLCGTMVFVAFIVWQLVWPEFFTTVNQYVPDLSPYRRMHQPAQFLALILLCIPSIWVLLKLITHVQIAMLRKLLLLRNF